MYMKKFILRKKENLSSFFSSRKKRSKVSWLNHWFSLRHQIYDNNNGFPYSSFFTLKLIFFSLYMIFNFLGYDIFIEEIEAGLIGWKKKLWMKLDGTFLRKQIKHQDTKMADGSNKKKAWMIFAKRKWILCQYDCTKKNRNYKSWLLRNRSKIIAPRSKILSETCPYFDSRLQSSQSPWWWFISATEFAFPETPLPRIKT